MNASFDGQPPADRDSSSPASINAHLDRHADTIALVSQVFGQEVGAGATSDDPAQRVSAYATAFRQVCDNRLGGRNDQPVDNAYSQGRLDRQLSALVDFLCAGFDDPDGQVVSAAIIQSVLTQERFAQPPRPVRLSGDAEVARQQAHQLVMWPRLAEQRLQAIESIIGNPPDCSLEFVVACIARLAEPDRGARLDLVLRLADNLVTDQQRLAIGWQAAEALVNANTPARQDNVMDLVPRLESSDPNLFADQRAYADDRLTALVARAMAQDSTFDTVDMGRLAAKCAFFTPAQYALLLQHLDAGPKTDAAVASRGLVDAKRLARRPIIQPSTSSPRSMFDRVRSMFRIGE